MADRQSTPRCILALEDGTVFTGVAFGAAGTRSGEVVFNTSMTGYQEILTDPSYCGQIVTMTSAQIGNYGVNDDDGESDRCHASGFVVKALAPRPSNQRATSPLEDWLARQGVIGIAGIDTRALTRKLRVEGAMQGVITTEIADPVEAVRTARQAPPMAGADFVSAVAPENVTHWTKGLDPAFHRLRDPATPRRRVVAIDCGMKRNILRHLVDVGCNVTVVGPAIIAAQLLDYRPDGVFVSNGPGDPAAVTYAVELLRSLLGRVPVFGICLGHQLLGLAMGARTYKLKFGHHGANHPVRNLATDRIEITSQNHGFAVDADSLARVGGQATHINLNDQTLEGFVYRDAPAFAVQYHPEAAPGPHDASYLFDCFRAMMDTGLAPTAQSMAEAQSATARRHARRTVPRSEAYEVL